MTQKAEIPHKKTAKSATVWVLCAISLIYIGIVYLLIKETATCEQVAVSANSFRRFWDQYLGCRSVNELGDTLAGAFAPVAFLWLMGAVFIQSQELRAQREELDETQEVMRAQLEVSRQQVEETRASTALLKIQTNVLEKDQIQKDQQRTDREFDERMRALITLIKREYEPSSILVRRFEEIEEDGVTSLVASGPGNSGSLFPRLIDIEVEELGPKLQKHSASVLEWLNNIQDMRFIDRWTGEVAADLVISTIQEILNLEDNLSDGCRERMYAMDVEGMIHDIHSIVEKVKSLRPPKTGV
ncbi:hypothetical protein [Brucella pituitosa]|uniref:hypothetical protein n=1 Tax=Brucella pituitosa TaxID=571256 RepID=UPI003F4AA8F3